MSDYTSDKRVLLRVVSVATELKSTRDSAHSPPSPSSQHVQVTLWPFGAPGYDLLGGQKIILYISDPRHPLLASIAVDRVFELRPVDPEGR